MLQVVVQQVSKHRATTSAQLSWSTRSAAMTSLVAAALLGGTTYAAATESGSDESGSSGGGRGATINEHTDSQVSSGEFVTAYAKCAPGEVPVNGYWLVDGEDPDGSSKAVYSLGDTGEQRDGYRVHAAKNTFGPASPLDQTPVTITAVARCLVADDAG